MHRAFAVQIFVFVFFKNEYSGGILTSGDMEVFQIAVPSGILLRIFEPRIPQPTKFLEAVLELFGCLKTSKFKGRHQHTHIYILSRIRVTIDVVWVEDRFYCPL